MARLANFLILISIFSVAKLFNPISCSCTENPIHALFVFGDSLYDAGNKKYISNAANPSESCIPSEFWPYGRFNDDPNGRFSDGYIVPDFIAEFLHLPLIPPFKESGEFKCGANFAAAGAGVVGWLQQPMYLFQQVDSFQEIRSKYWPEEVLKNSIYLFAIGAGDYIQLVKSKNQSINDPEWLPYIARNILKDIEDQVMKIYNLGGRKFGFQNLAPLDLLPRVKQEINNDTEINILKLLVRYHNAQLESALMALKGYEPYHELDYSILDYYGAIKRRVANPSKYGFNYVEDACCGIGIYNTSCSILNEGCCPAPSEYAIWDGIHNTHRANAQLARLFWEANQSVVTPVSLRKLISKPKPFDVHDEL